MANAQVFLGIVWRIYVGFVDDIDIKILGVHIKILGVPPSGRACLS
jgi:hypothetical protein